MPKPDKALRTRPLKEVELYLKQLKHVVLVHPDPIVLEMPTKMCVCGKGERKRGRKDSRMIQCDECLEWFHWDCASVGDDFDAEACDWKCEWCHNGADEKGFMRWKSGRKKAKLRHVNDTPKARGVQVGDGVVKSYSAPPSWEGKVEEVKELSRRLAVKKRKLRVAVQELVDGGGHHVVDAEGAHGVELRAVDDGLVDEMVGAGLVDPDNMSDE